QVLVRRHSSSHAASCPAWPRTGGSGKVDPPSHTLSKAVKNPAAGPREEQPAGETSVRGGQREGNLDGQRRVTHAERSLPGFRAEHEQPGRIVLIALP